MGNKENNSGSNGNRRKPFYRKINKSTLSTRPKMVREIKFHLHDSMQRKSSESFGKIKEAIITKISLEFENPIEIVESLKTGTQILFRKPC